MKKKKKKGCKMDVYLTLLAMLVVYSVVGKKVLAGSLASAFFGLVSK